MPYSACHLRDGECISYRDGHLVHTIQARLVGQSPWGWRDGILETSTTASIRIRYIDEDVTATCWHHHDISDLLPVGDPVRLHERFRVLGSAAGWHSVSIVGGVGPVPAPEHPELWHAHFVIGIVNLGTGVALPTDRPQTER